MPVKKRKTVDPTLQVHNENEFTSDYDEVVEIEGGDFGIPVERKLFDGINSSFELSDDEYEFEDTQTLHSLEDPINNLQDSHLQLVLQHFSGSEIRDLLCVSRDWHRELTRSTTFKDKLKLSIKSEDLSQDDCNFMTMLGSRRQYSSIEIYANNNRKVEKKIDVLMKKFSRTTVNLSITKVGGFNSFLKTPLPFPLLKSLEINISCGRISPSFKQINNLESLSVNGVDPPALIRFLRTSPSLKKLTLYENSFISYLDKDISTVISQKLKKLAILDHITTENALRGEFSVETWNGQERINFFKIIGNQGMNLTSLHLDVCLVQDLNAILGFLQVLQCLELNKLTGNGSSLDIKPNSSIKTFIASSACDVLLIYIITSFQHLKTIFIQNISSYQFLFIIRHAISLRSFFYFWATEALIANSNFVDLKKIYVGATSKGEVSQPSLSIYRMKKLQFMEMIEEQEHELNEM